MSRDEHSRAFEIIFDRARPRRARPFRDGTREGVLPDGVISDAVPALLRHNRARHLTRPLRGRQVMASALGGATGGDHDRCC